MLSGLREKECCRWVVNVGGGKGKIGNNWDEALMKSNKLKV